MYLSILETELHLRRRKNVINQIQSQTIVLRTRVWRINPTNSVFIPQSLVLRSCLRLNFNISKLVYCTFWYFWANIKQDTDCYSPLKSHSSDNKGNTSAEQNSWQKQVGLMAPKKCRPRCFVMRLRHEIKNNARNQGHQLALTFIFNKSFFPQPGDEQWRLDKDRGLV